MPEPLFVWADQIVTCEYCGKKKRNAGPPYCCTKSYEEEIKKVENLWKSLEERTERNSK